ncbi:MAG: hypothetical protein FWG72_03010 [Oscillospiraceae bacterium]|nr:hypothetical protein [Oscillospiraceae bacterium]
MDGINVNGSWVSQESYHKAVALTANRQENANARSVANSVWQMFAGWGQSTDTKPFLASGVHNVSIHPQVFRDMANDPEKMIEMKARFLDTIKFQQWGADQIRARGDTVIAMGTIFSADGSSSSWTIARTPDTRAQRRSLIEIPKNEKPTWVELMRRHMEQMRELKAAPAARGKSWTA